MPAMAGGNIVLSCSLSGTSTAPQLTSLESTVLYVGLSCTVAAAFLLSLTSACPAAELLHRKADACLNKRKMNILHNGASASVRGQ